jgi:molecular chaperone HtpG
MLLSENAKKLLPDWAFFLRAVVNTQYLRPTASREEFYEDELLEQTREELGGLVRNYLKNMAEKNAPLMERFIGEHHLALKSLAMEDEEILNTFLDYFPFETSMGTYTFGEIRKMVPVIKFVSKVDQFRQLAPVFAAANRMLINAGYVYDDELMQAVSYFRSDINLERLSPEDALFEMESVSVDEQDKYFDFIKYANEHLHKWNCAVEIKKYSPVELPALLILSDSASFASDLRYSKENSTDLFADILDQIDNSITISDTMLCFNANNELIQRLVDKTNYDATVLDLLYVQSMLMARRPLRAQEMQALNKGIINLIERSV